MSETNINTTDALTRKKWAKGLFKVVQKNFEFNSLTGTGPESVIQVKTDLGKGEGDQITFGIVLDLEGVGTVGRDTLEGKAEALRFRDFKMSITKIRKSVDIGQDIDMQRIPYNLMQIGKSGLNNWWNGFLSDYAMHVLAGNSQMVDELVQLGGRTFGDVPNEPDTNHFMRVGGIGTSEVNMTAENELSLQFLDGVKERAQVPVEGSTNFKIRPIMIGGKKYYRVILHEYVFNQLRKNTNIGEWGDFLRDAQKLKDPSVEILYNGMMIQKSERVYKRYSNIYRNLFLGAQSAVIAWGGAGQSKSSVMSFNTEQFDHKARTEISGGGILGITKTRFEKGGSAPTHGDYGCIVFNSWGQATVA